MNVLILSTFTVGILHALAPDHWLPFVALSKAQQWSGWKLTTVTTLAGLGHVSSSLLIALLGVLLGIAADRVSLWETNRGNIASLLLIGFGVAYMVWGTKNWGRKHSHELETSKVVSYWTMFALIVFGPCEPLIPLIFASSAYGWAQVFIVFILFGLSTIGMMLVQVHVATFGVSLLRSHRLEHASDVIAGGVIVLTGVTIRLLGI
jgi:hypothetical protein